VPQTKTTLITHPFDMIVFGGRGDLAKRKLLPALYHLDHENRLPQDGRIIAVSRGAMSRDAYRQLVREACATQLPAGQFDEETWRRFSERLDYVELDATATAAYGALSDALAGREATVRCFYLATAPELFCPIASSLAAAGLVTPVTRMVLEKPLGKDLASAQAINAAIGASFSEQQIFRIDHYLGKETVQNILTFRFSNALFERVWNREAVDHVQITFSEKLGVGGRGGFYEEAGALRDVVQNHLLQVLALIAMEPPVTLEAESIRDEKVKLLKSVRVLLPGQVETCAVRGQYVAGDVDGQARLPYRQEPKVSPSSNVETFTALKLFVDNWRWAGVPFYLRTGKNLALNASEVRVQFKSPPSVLFAAQCGPRLDANSITLRLQPNEGISLRFNGKIPGASMQLRPVRMHFSYHSEFGAYTPEAYERLLLDAMAGDATLFIRRDEVETAWNIVDPIREGWAGKPLTEREFYPAGSWGPKAAADLLERGGHAWRNPQPTA